MKLKQIITIQSTHNPLIKQLALLKQSKHRKANRLFIAEGVRTVTTLVNSGLELVYIISTNDHQKLACSLVQADTTVIMTTDAVITKLSSVTNSMGLIAIFKQPTVNTDLFAAPGLVLAQIADPGNMGTLIRSAAAFNAKTVVVVEGVDPWSPKVIQSSAGTIGMVRVFELPWHTLTQLCHTKNIALNALVVDGNSTQQVPVQDQLLVVGNEAHGLPLQWQQDCSLKKTIAMPGNTESLNAAVAGSIALYEMSKTQ